MPMLTSNKAPHYFRGATSLIQFVTPELFGVKKIIVSALRRTPNIQNFNQSCLQRPTGDICDPSGQCQEKRIYSVKEHTLRWCMLCNRWLHAKCCTKVTRQPKMPLTWWPMSHRSKEVKQPDGLTPKMAKLLNWPIERPKEKDGILCSYEILVVKLRQLYESRVIPDNWEEKLGDVLPSNMNKKDRRSMVTQFLLEQPPKEIYRCITCKQQSIVFLI